MKPWQWITVGIAAALIFMFVVSASNVSTNSNADSIRSVALVIAVLGAAAALGGVGQWIGAPKGHAAAGWLLGALLGPIGWLITAVLQPTPEAQVARERELEALRRQT